MGAVPKRKVSSRRRGNRRSHHHIVVPPLARCPQCRNLKPTHQVCPSCGTYRGRQVVAGRATQQ
ncbi:MAG TPA: 50S ribosomal protein L32 [Chloroflexota bacterium]|nr:50S ribosomal protein L32 [Chloroflexota bacterium]